MRSEGWYVRRWDRIGASEYRSRLTEREFEFIRSLADAIDTLEQRNGIQFTKLDEAFAQAKGEEGR